MIHPEFFPKASLAKEAAGGGVLFERCRGTLAVVARREEHRHV